jgi:type IV secretory pathway TrbD component
MQGLHVGPAAIMRGFMVSDWHWTLFGVILALVGVAQVVWTNTRQR